MRNLLFCLNSHDYSLLVLLSQLIYLAKEAGPIEKNPWAFSDFARPDASYALGHKRETQLKKNRPFGGRLQSVGGMLPDNPPLLSHRGQHEATHLISFTDTNLLH